MLHPAELRHSAPQFRVFFAFLLCMALAACAVHFVSDYDEVLDRTATETQKKITLLLTTLKDPSAPERKYSVAEKSYGEILSDLHAVRTRAEANNSQGGNTDTINQINTIETNVIRLQELHKDHPGSLNTGALELAQRVMDVQFKSLIQFELAKKRGKTPGE
jgi:hypothetical protein